MTEILEIWYVSIYLRDRAYGGAEEGGWWFDKCEPQESKLNKMFDNEDQANSYANKVRQFDLPEMNKGRRSIYSVLSEGIYEVIVDDKAPEPFPAVRPHYE